jgi:hypothetical protein
MDCGVVLFEVVMAPLYPLQSPLHWEEGRALYPTGTWAVVHRDQVGNLWGEELAAEMVKAGRAFLEKKAFHALILDEEEG